MGGGSQPPASGRSSRRQTHEPPVSSVMETGAIRAAVALALPPELPPAPRGPGTGLILLHPAPSTLLVGVSTGRGRGAWQQMIRSVPPMVPPHLR